MNKQILVQVDAELEELIPNYFSNLRKDIKSMRVAIASGDLKTPQLLGHNMKGSGGSYGFEFISKVGALIEKNSLNKKTEVTESIIEKQLSQVEDYLSSIKIEYI